MMKGRAGVGARDVWWKGRARVGDLWWKGRVGATDPWWKDQAGIGDLWWNDWADSYACCEVVLWWRLPRNG